MEMCIVIGKCILQIVKVDCGLKNRLFTDVIEL